MADLKILSWNIKGMSTPEKRRKIYHFLSKQKLDIICLEEVRVKKGKNYLMQNKRLGKHFYSLADEKKRGVTIYIRDNIPAQEIFKDESGHQLAVEITWQNQKILLVGVYGPHKAKEKFYKRLEKTILDMDYEEIILLGDWNGVLNPQIDRQSGRKIKQDQGKLPIAFNTLMKTTGVVDVWRHLYGNQKGFTFYSEAHSSLSRIDMFLTSKTLIPQIKKMEILPRTLSDHNAILLVFKKKKRTDFSWKLNENMLQDPEIVKKAKDILTLYFAVNKPGEVKMETVLDASKAVIRGFFIQQNAIRNKIKREKLDKINEAIKEKEIELHKNPSNKKTVEEIKFLQKQLDLILSEEIAKKLTRWKQKNFEWANKAGKRLALRLRKQQCYTPITKITDGNHIHHETTKIKKIFEQYYTNLHQNKTTNKEEIQKYLDGLKINRFTEEDRRSLNRAISTEEIEDAIQSAKINKAPGPDGLTAKYYKVFQENLTKPLHAIMHSLKEGKIPESWKNAYITVIPKEDRDPLQPKNYRPISLLNADYKLFMSILANRLKNILKRIISKDQAGFLPNRQIKQNTRCLIDIIELFDKHPSRKLAILFLDIEKAFDSLSWDFMMEALQAHDMGDQYMKTIRTIYKDQYAQLIINGEKTQRIRIRRGTRQGCPLSPLLFIMCIEMLIKQINGNKEIKGVQAAGKEYKIRAFADDIVMTLENPNDSKK
uniref:Reverse transcriptase domain-containing protein n=1 Tax=Anolis carolinensis TaxID=28377 RepID=A0A803SU58_ANOCA